MSKNFFEETRGLREEIKKGVISQCAKIENKQVKDIVLQRQEGASYIKGITSYYLHKGLGGGLSRIEIIKLAEAVEIYSTSMVLIDNLIDKHNKRDGNTTYLEEYGPEMMGLASVYTANIGLLKLSPYLENFFKLMEVDGVDAVGKAITSAVSMDIEHPTDPAKILENIVKVNGITLGFPLGLIASTARVDKKVIFEIMRYGTDTGTAFGLYEEVRDFIGEHGRGIASEMKTGRIPYFMADLGSRESNFDIKSYINKELNPMEYNSLLVKLTETGAFNRVKKLIKNHFDYGKEVIYNNLTFNEAEKLDLLRISIEESLNRMI